MTTPQKAHDSHYLEIWEDEGEAFEEALETYERPYVSCHELEAVWKEFETYRSIDRRFIHQIMSAVDRKDNLETQKEKLEEITVLYIGDPEIDEEVLETEPYPRTLSQKIEELDPDSI